MPAKTSTPPGATCAHNSGASTFTFAGGDPVSEGYRVGDIITPNGTLRDWLIGNGYCKLVADEPANTVARPMSQRVRGVMTRAKAA